MSTLTLFEEHLSGTCGSAHTVRRYLRDAAEFLAFLGERPVGVVELEAWVSGLNHGARRPQTVARKLAAVRRWLAFCGARGDRAAMDVLAIVSNGYRVGTPVRAIDVRQVTPITRQEHEEAMRRAPEWGTVLLALLWHSGCRISEVVGDAVAAIPPLSVDQGRRLVEVGAVETRGKRGARRLIVLPTRGREALRPYVQAKAEEVPESEPLFDRTAQAVNSMIHRAGVEGGAHRWRHAFRARARRAGVHDSITACLMGHAQQGTTNQYGAPDLGELVEASERMAAFEEVQ